MESAGLQGCGECRHPAGSVKAGRISLLAAEEREAVLTARESIREKLPDSSSAYGRALRRSRFVGTVVTLGVALSAAFSGEINQANEPINTATDPVYHIVEAPGAVDRLAEEAPTDYYYEKLLVHLLAKFPKSSQHFLDHLVSLEAFLDRSILCGFSYGVEKADLGVIEGKLLGHWVARTGGRCDPGAAQGVRDFAPLREKLHIQQFLGCTH